jgi:glycosyltransferase involved in cell wall biosynthesis
MAMGKPVIAPDGTSTTETLIIPGKTGLLFEAGSEEAFSSAILTLARDPALRQRMGNEAGRYAHSNFTWRQQVQDLIHAFDVALDAGTSATRLGAKQ